MKNASGFDVGTSPHGLSASRRERIRKHSEGSACTPSAKPLLTLPEEVRSSPAAAGHSPAAVRVAASAGEAKGKRREMVDDAASSMQLPPPCATQGEFQGMRFVRYVPVAFAARDWKVSPRRIRALLAESRLEGRREANGYWEVAYPYRFTFGQRGPALKRSQKQERCTA